MDSVIDEIVRLMREKKFQEARELFRKLVDSYEKQDEQKSAA